MRTIKKMAACFLCAALTLVPLTSCGISVPSLGEDAGSQEESTDSDNPLIADAASYIDLAEYQTITLDASEIDEELQSGIDDILEDYTTYKKIKKGSVKDGDTVNIYYVGTVDGEEFDGGSCTEDSYPDGYDLTIGSGAFIDGFEDGLIGKKIGKTYDIEVTFPDSYGSSDLAGQDAVFAVTLNYKQGAAIVPEFDDDFVTENLSDYSSVEDYNEQERAAIIQEMAIEKVCEDTTVNDYPEDKLEAMKTQLKTSIENYLTQLGYTLDDYLESLGLDEEAYDEQLEETAKEDVGNQLVYNAIAQAEGLEITDDAYQTELENYLSNYGYEDEESLDEYFDSTYGTTVKSVIYSDLLYDLVAEYLAGNVVEE